jgi:glycerophosphoryl diester phosphodiesterase
MYSYLSLAFLFYVKNSISYTRCDVKIPPFLPLTPLPAVSFIDSIGDMKAGGSSPSNFWFLVSLIRVRYIRLMKFCFNLLGIFVIFTQVNAQTPVPKPIYVPKFDLQGHRGARGLKPENTIPAFLIALDTGVTTIELDLAITSDKQVVVSHEPWMSSTICMKADGSSVTAREEKKFNIFQMPYDEVKQFDCGSKGNAKFPEQEKMKVSKPLLSEVIATVEDHIRNYTQYEVDYNIEIKSSPDGDNKFHPAPQEFSDLVYNLIDQYLPWERVVIQSFDFRVLKYWHEKYPGVRLAALVENNKTVYANLKELGFTPSIYSPYFKLLSSDDIQHLHQQRIRVIPWTVNETADIKKMRQMGVDGLITDYPNRASQLGLGIKRPKN